MNLILEPNTKSHVSQDTIRELEHAILSDNHTEVHPLELKSFASTVSFIPWKTLDKIGATSIAANILKFRNSIFKPADRQFISIHMGAKFGKYFPYCYHSGFKYMYMFDAWERRHQTIINFVKTFGLSHVFVSSSQAVDMLQSSFSKPIFHWVPEAISPELYRYSAYEQKDIDVLALGRRYDKFHSLIVEALEEDNRNYLYEKNKGEIIFPSREEFIDGLARSKISICIPGNITHPERAGSIGTMTVRYLQSMASKCLILGHAPKEMIDLFAYNPVIEIDWNEPLEQLKAILENYDDHIPLIEKNFKAVVEGHTWQNRWQLMSSLLG